MDVVIVGSGPAGISTALHLLKIDPSWKDRLVIFEKEAHPRHKLCGGGMTYYGLRILRRLNFPVPLPIPHARVDDARIIYNQDVVHVRGYPRFVVFQRAELDAYLAVEARKRGIVIYENEPVMKIQPREQRLEVKTDQRTLSTQVVVGSDGTKGIVRRLVGGNRTTARTAVALEVINPAYAGASLFASHWAIFDFTPVRQNLQGYYWDFPSHIDGLPMFNRGVYHAHQVYRTTRANLRGILNSSLLLSGVDLQNCNVNGHPIHRFSPSNRFARDRMILVGDAAGVDPLFGEGIAPALGYGEVAAQAIQDAFERGDFSFGLYKRRLLLSGVGRYLLVRWAVAGLGYRLCQYPWYMRGLWGLGKLLVALSRPPRVLDDPS